MAHTWIEPKYLDPTTKPFIDAYSMLNVFSKEDVSRVLFDTETFGVTPLYEDLRHKNFLFGGMWAFDGPLHDQHKGLLLHPFAGREMLVREVVLRQCATIGERFDIGPLALQISSEVICSILGAEKAMIPQFIAWLQELTIASSTTQMPDQPALEYYLRGFLKERREHPQHDMIDDVITAAPPDFSEWDILSYIWVFIAAGTETTAAGIASMLVLLAEHDGCWERLRQDRTLIPPAVEECLRTRPSFPALLRSVLQPCQLGGYELTKGMRVLAWASAAHGGQPFDITRKPNPHYAFGGGLHTCYGAPLARLEMRVTLEVLLEKLAHLRLREPPEYERGIVIGVKKAEFEGSSDEK